jgi:hypothetical protein
MDDPGTLAACLQRNNAFLDVTIGNRYPAMLAQVFGPGFGDKMLDETFGLFHIAEDLPVHRAIPQPDTAQ